ncbi:hypothetical protein BLEM_1641 [Bifidobacterium lemurum]|uniref:Uncharacterized protein n=1 Tax=Bifidobacterium lemurum TaxID=1603886 RepID=A0A261FP14_9BIFI|nr:hypothetical protein [Bifidobacterium lemurum]OZG60921.1 hypothetical protein BLEM_1641 [Bifidobacterium lemurum]QOL35004.1 hypothetical protein BL8807_03760 [Bifidobacterium lemurum]
MRTSRIHAITAVFAVLAMIISMIAIVPTAYALDTEVTGDTDTSVVDDGTSVTGTDTDTDDSGAIDDGTAADDADNTGGAGDDAGTTGTGDDIYGITGDGTAGENDLPTDDSDTTVTDADKSTANQDATAGESSEIDEIDVSDERNGVSVNGVYHDEAFTSEDGTITLGYDDDGNPTLTLDNAHITTAGGLDGHVAVAGIKSETDLTILLQGENTIEIKDDTHRADAIDVDGKLTIIGDDWYPYAKLHATLTYTPASSDYRSTVISADSFSMRDAQLDLTYVSDDANGTVYGIKTGGNIDLNDGTVTLTAPETSSNYYGLNAGGNITLTDTDLTSSGEWLSVLAGENILINDFSQLNLSCADERWPAAIYARQTLRFDLRRTGSVQIQPSATDPTEAFTNYAMLAERIELMPGVAVTDPTEVTIGEVYNPYTFSNAMGLIDTDGNAVSGVTIEASAEGEPPVGTTFMYDGFEYTITGNGENNGTLMLTGVDSTTDQHRLCRAIRLAWGNTWERLTVTDVRKDTLAEMTGTLVIDSDETDIANMALNSGAIGNGVTFELWALDDLTLTESGFTTDSATVDLPGGRRFDRVKAYYDWATITNESGATVPVTIVDYENDQTINDPKNPIQVADKESLDTRVLSPNLASIEFNLMYRVVGSDEGWQPLPVTRNNFSGYDPRILSVTLPDSVPADATIQLSFRDYLGKTQGYITSSWDDSREITLARGQAEDTATFTSSFAVPDRTQDYKIRVTTSGETGDADNAVYINGVYHDEDFVDAANGIALVYDEDDKPTLTLTNANLTALGAPLFNQDDAAAIRSATDLTIRLNGKSTASITNGTKTSSIISVAGDLTIIGNSADGTSALTIKAADAASLGGTSGFMTHLIEASNITVQQATLDMTYDGNGAAYALCTDGDITVTDSTITMGSATLASRGIYSGLYSGHGDITVTDSALNATDGKMDSLIYAVFGNATVSGNSQVDMSFGAEHHFSPAIFAYYTLTFDLQESGFVQIKATHPDVNPHALMSIDIVLGENTEISDPEGAAVGSITDGRVTYATLLDKEGNVVSDATLKAKAAPAPEQPGQTDSDKTDGNGQAAGEKLSATGSGVIPLVMGALTLAMIALCAGVVRRARGAYGTRGMRHGRR